MIVIGGNTKILGIFGWPVEHSLSPLMQNAALEQLGLDYVYLPFPVSPSGLEAAVNGMRAMGIAGVNVTIPHKQTIMPYLDALAPEAEACGAVNVVKSEGGKLVGHNTDGVGLIASLREDLDLELRGAGVVLLGAGGAARGAVAALCAAGVAGITIACRTVTKGEQIAERFRTMYPEVALIPCPIDSPATLAGLRTADLLLNTTSVGMDGTSFAGLDLMLMKPAGVVYDMVYAPPVTPLLAAAAARGLRVANGLGMLAGQGEAAFAIWTGEEPPRGLMKACLVAATSRMNRC